MKSLLIVAMVSTSAFAGDYIVKLKDGAQLTNSFHSIGQAKSLNLKSGNFYIVKNAAASILDMASLDSNVEYVEENITYSAFDYTPNDDRYGKQWGLDNTGKNSGGIFSRGTKGVDISAVKAWSITKGHSDIKIAVIDTGVDYTHKDLKNNIMINDAELNGIEGVDDDGNGFVDDIYGYDFANSDSDPKDGHGHGTHCAGVIGASHNNGGIAGVNSNVKILPIKFLTDKGSGSLEGALKSIDYAITRGVDVMSNSWGGGKRSQALFDVIQKAQEAGIIFIAAAGNANSDNDRKPAYPASYQLDNVVSVGAMTAKGKRARFSNYGKKSVHVFAPGVDILSTVTNNGYKKMSGTSMACPHVAGVAGLLLANEPNLTYAEIKTRLMDTAVRVPKLNAFTASGYVDAYNALTNKK